MTPAQCMDDVHLRFTIFGIHLIAIRLQRAFKVFQQLCHHRFTTRGGIIKHDIKRAKRKVKAFLPDINKGKYFSVNDISKKVVPHEQAAITELDEIIRERNLLINI